MISREKVNEELQNIFSRRNEWRLSMRPKNLETLSRLAIDEKIAFEILVDNLTWKNYISGPKPDNHMPPSTGDIWIFGININSEECYLKFQDKPNGIVIWISYHIALYPLHYPLLIQEERNEDNG
ncbi:hypothetical protein [Companilactobacillus sp. HBUAS59699]|uniref:hypothetical protein n=1 Tax=Companilactobacillus sp. HBUAS59699 TaxID=3109358 RepID=UPI002FF0977F